MAPDDLAGQPARDDLAGAVAQVLLPAIWAVSSPLEQAAVAGRVEEALALILAEERTWRGALQMLEDGAAELEAELERVRDGARGGLW